MVERITGNDFASLAHPLGQVRTSREFEKESIFLEDKLKSVSDKQGFMGKIFNGVKEITDLGQSYSDCEKMLDKYKTGKISFDEALQYIENFDKKQTSGVNLLSNITTGVATIAATVVTGGGAIIVGAPLGAGVKTGLKALDRATNNVKGDVLDGKTIAKDMVTGALTGATSAVSSGVGAGIKAGNFGLAVRNGAKCGLLCGAASGAGTNLADVAFGDRDFDLGDLAKETALSAFVSGTVGAGVGAGMYGIANAMGDVGKETAKTTTQTIVADSASSTTRKILGQGEKNLLNVA